MTKIPMSVRFIYLVSADRSINNEYKNAIENTAKSLQTWYKNQMNDLTFTLNTPIVEVIQSDKNASYFYSNPVGDRKKDDWGFFNGRNEVSRILGEEFNVDNYTWVIYSDGPGDKGRGMLRVCVMPEDDLIGLIKEYPEKNRWIGGGGHELGHAFGLNDIQDNDALMGKGIYGKYPDEAYLTEEDKRILINNPFFKTIRSYSEGIFEHSLTQNSQWTEYKNTNNDIYYFTQYMSDESFYYLKSTDRNYCIKLPKSEGISFISEDNEKTWTTWWTFNS